MTGAIERMRVMRGVRLSRRSLSMPTENNANATKPRPHPQRFSHRHHAASAKQVPINESDSLLANEYLQEKERLKRAVVTRDARRAAKKGEERLGGGPSA